MKITFLGTGTSIGVPVIGCQCAVCQSADARDNRLRSSILWEADGKRIVIDAGPDFRQQMLRARCSRIDAILVTHRHYDHVGGLDDVRGINYSMHCSVDIFADDGTAATIRRTMPYVFATQKYPGVPDMHLHEIDENPFDINGTVVTPIPVMHHKMPIFGYRIGDWAYITDASYISDESLHKLTGCEVLVINALRKTEHMSHFSLAEAIDIVDKVKPQRAYFTHIGHEMGLHAEEQPKLPRNIFFAYDGLVVE